MKARMYEAIYKNVRIRPLECDDIEKLRVWRNDKEKTKFLRDIGNITPEMQSKWFENYLKRSDEVIFAIEEIEELNRVVGSLSLYDFIDNVAEIGKIQIGDTAANGKGIGRVSLVMAMFIGFQKLDLNKVIASVNPNNVSAYKNDIKIGFEVCGQHNFMDGIEYELFMDYERLSKTNLYLNEIKVMEYDSTKNKKGD